MKFYLSVYHLQPDQTPGGQETLDLPSQCVLQNMVYRRGQDSILNLGTVPSTFTGSSLKSGFLFPSLLQHVMKVLASTLLSCLSTVPKGRDQTGTLYLVPPTELGQTVMQRTRGTKLTLQFSFLVFDESKPYEEVCHFRGAASSTGAEQKTLFRKNSGGDAPGSQTDSFLISLARSFVRMEGP